MRVLLIGRISYYKRYPVLFDEPDDFFLIVAFGNEIVDLSTFRLGGFDKEFEAFPDPCAGFMLLDTAPFTEGSSTRRA